MRVLWGERPARVATTCSSRDTPCGPFRCGVLWVLVDCNMLLNSEIFKKIDLQNQNPFREPSLATICIGTVLQKHTLFTVGICWEMCMCTTILYWISILGKALRSCMACSCTWFQLRGYWSAHQCSRAIYVVQSKLSQNTGLPSGYLNTFWAETMERNCPGTALDCIRFARLQLRRR